MTTVLDCTLRDGGYYNDWNFPVDVANKTINSLHEAGVDIIELGLKSASDNKCSGLFKYCAEDYLEALVLPTDCTLSFMLNVKEFIQDGAIDRDSLDKIIRPAKASIFDMCRLASHYSDFELIGDFHRYFWEKGYRVGINLMGVSLLESDQLKTAMVTVDALKPEVFYIADSFGSMLPENITNLVDTIRKNYNGQIGIHTHDNQGLAFANSLRAIDLGVEYIDATLTGMGRGAGNLSTEQILLWLQNKSGTLHRYHSGKVLEIIHDYYEPLKQHYGWGFNYVYMLSGLNNIHPVYCMELCDGNKFSMSQVSTILEAIPHTNRASFNAKSLKSAINTTATSVAPENDNVVAIDKFSLSTFTANSKACLIVSTGSMVKQYSDAMCRLVSKNNLSVIECNDTGAVDGIENRITAVLNRMRLAELLEKPRGDLQTIVTGEETVKSGLSNNVFHFPFAVGSLNISNDLLSIPDYEAGQYAISLAISLGYHEIYLAGFSGYELEEQNLSMDNFFRSLFEEFKDLSMTSITPTQYLTLPTRSIYTI